MIEFAIITDYDGFRNKIDERWYIDALFPDGFPEKESSNFYDVSVDGKWVGYIGVEYVSEKECYLHAVAVEGIPSVTKKIIFNHFINAYNDCILYVKMNYFNHLETILFRYGFRNIVIEDGKITAQIN